MRSGKNAALVLVGLVVFGGGQAAHAQQAGVVYAGWWLDDLQAAVTLNVVSLDTPELRQGFMANGRDQIPYAAVFVPTQASADQPTVYVLPNRATQWRPVTVKAGDVAKLRDHATTRFAVRLRELAETQGDKPEQVKALLTAIEDAPADRRTAVRHYAGFVLADRGVSDPQLAGLIDEYRKAQENKVRTEVAPAKFEEGKPYSFGVKSVPERHVRAIPAASVAPFTVDGEKLNKAWVGSSLILVKPSREGGEDNSIPVFDTLKLSSEIKSRLKDGHDRPLIPLPPPPVLAK